MKQLCALIAIVWLLCVRCTAQEQITPDKRLEQKVTIKAIGRPLGDFLADLSASTGVKMTARKDVADDKLVVLVKDLPLLDLQDAIKEVLHLRCTREGKNGEWEYEFWMDLKTRQEAAQWKEEEVGALRNYMERLVEDLKLSPEELAARYEEYHPLRQEPSNVLDRVLVEVYASLSNRQADTLWQKGGLSLSKQNLSAETRSKLVAAMNWIDEWHSRTLQTIPIMADTEEAVPPFGLRTRSWTDANCIDLEIQSGFPDPGVRMYCVIRGTVVAQLPAMGSSTMETATIKSDFGISFMASANHLRSELSSLIGELQTSDDKLNSTPICIQSSKPLNIYEVLGQIAEQADINFVSDYFTYLSKKEWSPRTLDRKATLRETLVRIIYSLVSRITQKDNTFLLSNTRWFEYREREIPERLVSRWKKIKEERGLGLKEICEMSTLAKPQIQDLELYDLGYGTFILENYKLLSFLASLSPKQWTQALEDNGLAISGLSGKQYDLLLDWAESDESTAAGVFNKNAYIQDEPVRTIADSIMIGLERIDPEHAEDHWACWMQFKDGSRHGNELNLFWFRNTDRG